MSRRISLIFILFILLFGIILIKLFFLQVISFEGLAGLAEKQRSASIPIPASRGRILAVDGSPLVINQKTYGIYLEPKNITDKESVIDTLAKVLDISTASVAAKLNTSALWLPLVHSVDEKTMTAIKTDNLKGVGFMNESARYYPESSMAAQLLGFVGKNASGENQGYFGLEGYYDQQLSGRDGSILEDVDPLGNPILTADRETIPAENGRDLKLYLDKTIQFIAEKYLQKGVQDYGAKGGTVTIMDPKTGGVLAMVSFPSYDPAHFGEYTQDLYKNPTVSSSYEPGSTFKVLIMSSAINEGKIKSDSIINEEGPVEIGGYTINTWNQQYHGKITATQVLDYSSNVGMVDIEKKLNHKVLLQYIENFGIGQTTGVDLQEETSPDLRPKDKWYEIDYATSSFGQGIAVTPLQMIRAVATIANKGKLMEPHIVKEIDLPDGSTITVSPKVVRQVFKPEVASILTEMMVSAVDNGETRAIKPVGFRIAGKTGTAQIPIAGHYDSQKTISSFVGFAPVENPAFVMLVTLNEPTSSPWGSETAAPIFFNIARDIFSYLGISPSS